MTSKLEGRTAAEAILVRHEVDVPPGARGRVALGVERRLAPWRATWAQAGLTMAAAAAVLVLRFGPPTEPRTEPAPVPAEAPRFAVGAALPAGESTLGPARLTVEPGAELRLAKAEGETVLRLWRGRVDLDVGPLARAEPVEIHTRQVRIRILGARFAVEARDASTVVDVQAGQVAVFAGRADTPRLLGPGRRVRVGPPSEAPAREAAPSAAVRRAETTPRGVGEVTADAAQKQADLRDARRWLPSQPERAGALAERVIAAHPASRTEVEALLLLADARRRAGQDRAAVEAYRRVLAHPERAGFEEEARYRVARALARLGDVEAARAHLEAAHAAHPGGPLAPERAALWAKLWLDAGDPERAAEVLEASAGPGWSRLLDERRLEVARALLSSAPRRATRLADRVITANRAPDLVEAARTLIAEAK